MSLRLRLTLLYASLLGGVLLIFGALVYTLTSVILLDQIDSSLADSANQIISQLRVNSSGQFDPRALARLQISENTLFQVWGGDRTLQFSRPSGAENSLDDIGRRAGQPMFNSTLAGARHLRVLSVPMVSERGEAGILQVGQNLNLVDTAQRSLASILVMLTLFTMLVSAVAAHLVTTQALAPLSEVTNVATQITRADDLSRRIQLEHLPDDEVGMLVQAFNQTLERLEHLFTAQRRFMADVSHELRTPLTVIKGNIGLMRKFKEADEESLEMIDSEVDRLTRLVGDLLLLAQAETGRLPLAMQPVSLDTVLLEVFQQMRLLAGDRLKVNLGMTEPVEMTGDRDRLKQVFLNLVGNAVQYTPPGGQVNISLRRVNERTQVIISDTGPGIPAEDLPHIFERFYRGEKSRTRHKGTGFGLGLSIAYWIVHNHGGTIDVTSQEGRGTTFSVWLPLKPPQTPV